MDALMVKADSAGPWDQEQNTSPRTVDRVAAPPESRGSLVTSGAMSIDAQPTPVILTPTNPCTNHWPMPPRKW